MDDYAGFGDWGHFYSGWTVPNPLPHYEDTRVELRGTRGEKHHFLRSQVALTPVQNTKFVRFERRPQAR